MGIYITGYIGVIVSYPLLRTSRSRHDTTAFYNPCIVVVSIFFSMIPI